MAKRTIFGVTIVALLVLCNVTLAQFDPQIDRKGGGLGGVGCTVLFLFGFVLSIWAMNRNRSGCGWFVLGCIPIVNIFAALVALSAEDQRRKKRVQ